MAEIKPFRGLLYNKEKIRDFSLVITPPYDVISEKEYDEFSKLSEYNMINLILGKSQNSENKYEQIASYFEEWQKKKILKKDAQDYIYIYAQTFAYNSSAFTRIGFISLLKLEQLGTGILPHEKTLEKPFQDRLALINAAKANFGCVFMLYDDREKTIDSSINDVIQRKQADIDFEDKFQIRHRLWKISDPDFITTLKKEMLKYQCIIADGHHRYKSVLKFNEQNPELRDSSYTICCFINSFNQGLFILPIDRFIFNLKALNITDILNRLKEHFTIEEIKNVNELIKKIDNTNIMIDKTINLKNHVFGMYCYLNKKSYFLLLKNNNILDNYYKNKTDVYRKLDINILHKIIFKDILGISEEDQFKGIHIEYPKGAKRALDKLNDNKYQFAFFLNAPLMREIFLTARSNETMPQKSTYFYPKVYSGLVINKIEK